MQVEIFTLCDFARVYGNQLSIMGTIDALFIPSFPMRHLGFSIACKVNFLSSEAGEHTIRIDFIDQDARPILNPQVKTVEVVPNPELRQSSFVIAVRVPPLDFHRPGTYSTRLTVDGSEHVDLPLFVIQRQV